MPDLSHANGPATLPEPKLQNFNAEAAENTEGNQASEQRATACPCRIGSMYTTSRQIARYRSYLVRT